MNVTIELPSDATRIEWHTQFAYDEAVALSRKTGRPILLDLHSASSKGCRELDERVYSDPAVVDAISRRTIPVRILVDTAEADPITSAIVGSHIFIWSQTVQLVSPDGDIFHKFIGAPRHTRLDMGYTRVHHDVDGNLTARDFLAHLELGLGKAALFAGDFDRAAEILGKVGDVSGANPIAADEAAYWMRPASKRGVVPTRPARRATPTKSKLARAVERFCEALVQIPDSELMLDWHGSKPEGDWAHYSDCLREVVFGTYQHVLGAAHRVASERHATGVAPTIAQRMLASHHVAYRELQGLVVGIGEGELDRIHLRENRSLGKQRTVRNNLVHCVMAEWWAHAPAVRGTLAAVRAGTDAIVGTPQETLDRFGDPPNNFGDLGDLIARSEVLHESLLEEFANITDEEIDARARWWEGSPVSIRFRLGRFGWHLHDHAMVIETILERLGRKRTETERLARLVHRALGELEGALIGLPETERLRAIADVVPFVESRADELERLADSFVAKESN